MARHQDQVLEAVKEILQSITAAEEVPQLGDHQGDPQELPQLGGVQRVPVLGDPQEDENPKVESPEVKIPESAKEILQLNPVRVIYGIKYRLKSEVYIPLIKTPTQETMLSKPHSVIGNW